MGFRKLGWRPVNSCATLWRPVPPDWIPYILRFQILEAWIWRLEAWMVDAGRIGRDWRYLADGW